MHSKKDFDLQNDESDNYDSYADENADGTLEGAVYGLFAAEPIVHPDAETGTVYEEGDLVAIATTDRNGDASFMTFTEAPGTRYDYETGTTVTTDWNANAPKNLHTSEDTSATLPETLKVCQKRSRKRTGLLLPVLTIRKMRIILIL